MNKNVNRVILMFFILLVSCNADHNNEAAYDLEGNWNIYEAYRNEEITTTLEDGYFKFVDSSMETNILGSPISGIYVLDGNEFSHKSSLPVKYEISSYVSDSMELKTEIRGFNFRFRLNKVQDSIPRN